MHKLYDREIKYLAYDMQRKEIVEVSKIDFVGKWIYRKGSNQCYKFEDVEILEYSGNQDIHKKDIYEGHILLNPKTGFYYEVKFMVDRFVIERDLKSDPHRRKTQQTDPSSTSFTPSSHQWILGSSEANYEKNTGFELSDLYPTCEELEIAGFIFQKDLLEKVGYSKIHNQDLSKNQTNF